MKRKRTEIILLTFRGAYDPAIRRRTIKHLQSSWFSDEREKTNAIAELNTMMKRNSLEPKDLISTKTIEIDPLMHETTKAD